jgi:hypothetical protein
MTPAQRWPAQTICNDDEDVPPGEVCATLWPTRSLHSPLRWFDELYLWAEGFEPSPVQWSRIQLLGLHRGLVMLGEEQADNIAVTLSFRTVQRYDERIYAQLRAQPLVAHRLAVLLRGSAEQLRSVYRVRAFVDYLRAQQIPVGLRVTSPRLAMELAAFDLVQPDFAKILAPASLHEETWENMVVEARVAGLSEDWLIVAGLQSREQVELATRTNIGFGQGGAVRPAQIPARARRGNGARLMRGGAPEPSPPPLKSPLGA